MPVSDQQQDRVRVEGSAYVELEVSGRWALSLLTRGWTDEECQAFLDGDEDAKEALTSELVRRVMAQPDECEETHVRIDLSRALESEAPQ